MNKEATLKYINDNFDQWFVQGLADFVRIPNLTPMVDDEYLKNGLVEQAIDLVDQYIQKLNIKGISRKVFQPEGKTPLVVYVVEPTDGSSKNVMVYGHLDKQPWGTGWHEGLHATQPDIKGDVMYGRGSSDDGYAPFSCMLAVKAGQEQGIKMPRIALVLETEEESGSPNLIPLLKEAAPFIGTPDICFCMDSGALDYDQLWITSSLRGVVIVSLTVEGGKIGYHSGETGGIIPETFRITRALLDRLDDSKTGRVIDELTLEVPEAKMKEAQFIADKYGDKLYTKYEIHDGVKVMDQDNLVEMYLNNVWRPNMSITGADHLPPIAQAGNVLRSKTAVKISMRLPPAMDAKKAEEIIVSKLTKDVPYNAKVTIEGGHCGSGWSMKSLDKWLLDAISEAGAHFFDGKPTGSYGEGGSIPFLKELENMYPETQIVAFGLLGPLSNAHGPNECINLPYAKKLTCSLAHVIGSVGSQ